MAKVRNCVWVSPSSILTIAHNLFRQFLIVTFYKIVCQLVLFLFYETPPPDLLSSLLLVLLAGYFGFQVSARQLSAESVRGARFQAPEQLCTCLLAGAQNWESAGGKGEWDHWERPRRYIVTTDAPTGRPCAGVSAPPLVTHSFPSTSVCCLSAAATSKTILLRLSGAFS